MRIIPVNHLDAPFVENGVMSDIFAQGVERVEIMKRNARIIYWRWRYDGERWHRAALDFALVMPCCSFQRGEAALWHDKIVYLPGEELPH